MQTKRAVPRTSIVNSFHEPTLRAQVFIDAIQRGLFFAFPVTIRLNFRSQRLDLDVPFIARPGGFAPPLAFRSPRSGERQDSSARAFTTEIRRSSFLELDGRSNWRPENSHRCGRLFFRDRALFFHFRQNKTLLLERVGTVRVEQYGGADSAFPYRVLNSCERDFETLGIGREWQEESQLLGPCLHESRQHADGRNRQRRRVLLKIELQEFQKKFVVSRRHWKPERPAVKDRFLAA